MEAMTEQQVDEAAELSWGLKQSFRAYVEGAGGAIETGEGAQRSATHLTKRRS